MATKKQEPKPAVEKMPEEEHIETTADVLTEIPAEEEIIAKNEKPGIDLSAWTPRTTIGKAVKDGTVTSLDSVLDHNIPILEEQIVDALLPNIESDLILVGQSKGKFGGGQRRIFKQTQRKTSEGNKPSFATLAIIGNRNGYVGVGYGKSRETVPAREKSVRAAKLRVFKVSRGCGSWECGCREPHSVPFAVTGKSGSTTLTLMPAPKGKGLVVDSECAKILRLAGIKDVWSKSFGQVRTKINLIEACVDALKTLMKTKLREEYTTALGYREGPIRAQH
ncbi:30S ribosomal protein S5 [Candidatus Woesearchaeota archaeon]|nr:30S ribosomal protein S5 [Candidatus Woesearchaeota archaeon]